MTGSGSHFFNAAIGLATAYTVAKLCLLWLNRRNILAHRHDVPAAFQETVPVESYRRSVDYSLELNQFHFIQETGGWAILLLVLYSGVLPASESFLAQWTPRTPWSQAAWLAGVAIGLSVLDLPLDAWEQFGIEARHGFNKMTGRLWCMDRIKGLALGLILGLPLLALILHLVRLLGPRWWLAAWSVWFGFQFILMLLAPYVILPLFNRFTPLPDGSLKDRLLRLGEKTGFTAKSIQVMDGSRRSGHSNAFFTGFGRFRKIVLFDTLIQQLSESELEAVLAHEIGHYKRGHIPQMLAFSAIMSFAGFYALGWCSQHPALVAAFGFSPEAGVAALLLLFALLGSALTFWIAPILNFWSRRNEYQADAFARAALGTPEPLIAALRKLSDKNLSNLTPHPLFSAVHYSHPTLLERENALLRP